MDEISKWMKVDESGLDEILINHYCDIHPIMVPFIFQGAGNLCFWCSNETDSDKDCDEIENWLDSSYYNGTFHKNTLFPLHASCHDLED